MLQKKVCILGGPAVGKTSLVARLARNFFTERHLATIGVRIDKRVLEVRQRELLLVIWDLAGADEFTSAAVNYLRGAAGCLLTIDGTRRETLAQARHLRSEADRILGPVPFVIALNKADVEKHWQIGEMEIAELISGGWPAVKVSAKTGAGVGEAFRALAEAILERELQPGLGE